jgi:O-acetyl-ADP-ribose deacetylase (regulator of RNase III)
MTKFEIAIGNIADLKADAIVNAANEKLEAGGGVCGAIFAKASPGLEEEIAAEHEFGCETGDAVTTEAYGLDAKHIIHAVAPKFDFFSDGDKELRSAYRAIFREAKYWGVKSVAIPSLGTGIYGWSLEQATPVAKEGILEGLREYPTIETVILSCFTQEAADFYRQLFSVELEYGLDFVPRCPKCSKKALEISYGMPTEELLDDPNFYSGGCIIGPGQPNWACRDCEIEFA